LADLDVKFAMGMMAARLLLISGRLAVNELDVERTLGQPYQRQNQRQH
jgi:hypothetical protein